MAASARAIPPNSSIRPFYLVLPTCCLQTLLLGRIGLYMPPLQLLAPAAGFGEHDDMRSPRGGAVFMWAPGAGD